MSSASDRVAIFVPNLEGGGAERVMLALANAFSKSGLAVDLVLQRAAGPYLKDVAEGVRFVDLKASRLLTSVVPLARYLRTTHPSALLSSPADANIIAVAAAWLSRVPLRVIVREAIVASVHDAEDPGLRRRIIGFLRRRAYRRATNVIAPSSAIAKDVMEYDGVDRSRVTVIANPLDTQRIQRLASAPIEDVIVPPDAQMILGVGRLSPQKDFATLIRAFAKIPDRNAALVLLGEGSERENLQRLAIELGVQDRLFMPGFVENPFSYMRRAAVFVLSSRYEGLPNAMLQALLLGTPVVATDCVSGPGEILENGRWGRLLHIGDANAMAAAIQDGLNGKIERPPAQLIQDRYGLNVIASQYRKVLLPLNAEIGGDLHYQHASVG